MTHLLFIINKIIPVINLANTVIEFLKHNPNAVVLERASNPHLMDSVQGLVIKDSAKDLFSRQYSFIYEIILRRKELSVKQNHKSEINFSSRRIIQRGW